MTTPPTREPNKRRQAMLLLGFLERPDQPRVGAVSKITTVGAGVHSGSRCGPCREQRTSAGRGAEHAAQGAADTVVLPWGRDGRPPGGHDRSRPGGAVVAIDRVALGPPGWVGVGGSAVVPRRRAVGPARWRRPQRRPRQRVLPDAGEELDQADRWHLYPFGCDGDATAVEWAGEDHEDLLTRSPALGASTPSKPAARAASAHS